MQIDKTIFKAYDVRGVYPDQINRETAKHIAKACLLHLKQNGIFKTGDKIFVGRDVRNSSPELADTLINSFLDLGIDVDDGGIITTDLLYFTVGQNNYMAGIMVTASHNPPEYNGFKFVTRGVEFVSGKELAKMLDQTGVDWSKHERVGQPTQVNAVDAYFDYVNQRGALNELKKKFNVVLDPGNGSVSVMVQSALSVFPMSASVINENADGNFPGRGPNPQSNMGTLPKEVLDKKADFGVAWDNDGDRIFFVDDLGRTVEGDQTTALIAKILLHEQPGNYVIHDLVSSKSIAETAQQMGGHTDRSKVGYVFVKEVMRQRKAILGGEISAHIFFPFSAHKFTWYAECTWLTIVYVMRAMEQSGKKLSELVDEITFYNKTGPIVFNTSNWNDVFAQLKQKYHDGKQDVLDGLSVEYNDWWFNVRPSNTEPIIKLVVEAQTKDLLEQKVAELKEFISGLI